jgi:hypothetical protein
VVHLAAGNRECSSMESSMRPGEGCCDGTNLVR